MPPRHKTATCAMCFVALCLVVAPGQLRAKGERWTDPTFETMTAEADLIVIGTVVESGQELCQIQPLEVLKGQMPQSAFWVEGFNHPGWPANVIDSHAMQVAELYLLFIRSTERSNAHFVLTSPTAGDLALLADGLHGGWAMVSFPRAAPAVAIEDALTLLLGLLEHQSGQSPDDARALLARQLTVERVNTLTTEEAHDERVAYLDWLLGAQTAYGDTRTHLAVLAAAHSPNLTVAAAGTRALRSLGPQPDVLLAIATLLSRPGATFVQAAAAKTLLALEIKANVATPLLLDALDESDPRESGPRGVADPLRNAYPSGRETIIRALTQLRAADASPHLVRMIRDEGLSAGVFDALVDYFIDFPSPTARDRFINLYRRAPISALPHFHRYLSQEASIDSMQAMAHRISDRRLSVFDAAEGLETWALAVRDREPQLEKTVLTLLDRHRDDDAVAFLGGAAISAASDPVARTLAGIDRGPLAKETKQRLAIVDSAVALKLQPPPSPEMVTESWLALIERDREDNLLSEFLYRELVRHTPSSLRASLINRIRGRAMTPAAAAALSAMGARLTAAEREQTRRTHRMAP